MAFDAIRPLVDEQRLDIRTEAVEERIGARHLTPRVDACYELMGRVRRLCYEEGYRASTAVRDRRSAPF
jgi:hypothetical protein